MLLKLTGFREVALEVVSRVRLLFTRPKLDETDLFLKGL